jgi:hypothetical protein
LTCQGELARLWEFRLRKEIFWGAVMKDDRVIQPTFDIAHVYTSTRLGCGRGTDWRRQQGGAYTWRPPIQSRDDLEKTSLSQKSWLMERRPIG